MIALDDALPALLHEWGAQMLKAVSNALRASESLSDLDGVEDIDDVVLHRITAVVEQQIGIAGLVSISVKDGKLIVGPDLKRLNRSGFVDAFIRFYTLLTAETAAQADPGTVLLSPPETPI